jgi:hypothetical protein
MSQLQHWTFTNPSAMHFLPYYWYSQQGQCNELVKLDPELLFAQPALDYVELFEKLAADAIEAGIVYSSFERDCSIESSIEAANIVVNLPRYMALLNEFQQISESKFYVDGMFDHFLRSSPTNRLLMPASSLDLTMCLTESTVTWTAPTHDSPHAFLRIVMGDDTLYNTVLPQGAGAGEVRVF